MKHQADGETLTVFVEQDLVAANAEGQRDDLKAVLAEAEDIKSFVVDINDSRTVDSLGINLLVGACKEARNMNLDFRVVGASEDIKRLFHLYKLSAHFGVK